MYEPFPGNYVWNLSVNLALCMGGAIGEIERANDQLRQIAAEGEDKGTAAFFQSWGATADSLVSSGETARSEGRMLSAAYKYLRAVAYYVTAERMQSRGYAPRWDMYERMLGTMERAISAGDLNCERVEIPYGAKTFPGLFVRAHGPGPHPCIVFCNGLDSVKEMIYLCVRDQFALRGVSMLAVDQPGVGEALRLSGLVAIPEAERWAGAAVDYLESRADVDADRIGMVGWSLGGYYAPRAVCYETRLKLCVAWGANHNWGELQRRRLANEGDRPIPHYWDHVSWVWGTSGVDEFMRAVSGVSLIGHLNKLTVPFLVVHGEKDRQIPLADARQSYNEATGSPDRELKVFTMHEGGVEHVSADNMEPVRSYIGDWISERFRRMA